MARGRPQRGRPHIGGSGFNGRDSLSWGECNKLRASTVQEGVEKLIPGWNGGMAALTVAEIENTDRRVLNVSIHTKGELYTQNPKNFKSDKFFAFSDHTLVIHSIDSHLFTFSQDLSSSIVDGSRIGFHVKRNSDNHILTAEERATVGFEGFSVKITLIPESELWCKFTIVILPLSKAALLEKFPYAQDPKFPGLKLDGGHCRFCPGQSDVFPNLSWGVPFLPILLTSSPFTQEGPLPDSGDLRLGIAELLRKARKPEIKKDRETLMIRWREIEAIGANALTGERLPEKEWPAPSSGLRPPQGIPIHLIKYF